ncbi:protein of unknown function [Nitrospira defluvii]|uniref:Uncharacterized protein n=1 Tax=Nitrospira defluvii TaxID=330214 RepID=D8PJA2_9BACT|nr:protein of unknown function [Nitrospira defluvii]
MKAWQSCRKCAGGERYQGRKAVAFILVGRQVLWTFAPAFSPGAAEILRSRTQHGSLHRPLKPPVLC